MAFELITTPTFMNQLFDLPRDQARQVDSKINAILRVDPYPDTSKTKKPLKKYSGKICRLRCGDYRVAYAYGDGWVKLLAAKHRRDVYDDEYFIDTPDIDISLVLDTPEKTTKETSDHNDRGSIKPVQQYLPTVIDVAMLERLQVPPQFHEVLLACRTEEDLLDADAPSDLVERVIDVVLKPELSQVLAEPTLLVQEEHDLIRFVEGDLLTFLLKLSSDQERMVDWGMKGSGPTLVKGGPGTGKSTIALYRTQAIVRALKAQGVRKPRVLFTTYTRTLADSSEQLLRRLLGDDAQFVEVKTADNVTTGVFRYLGLNSNILDNAKLLTLLRHVIEAAGLLEEDGRTIRTLGKVSDEYVLEEIGSVIEAREIANLDQYLTVSRTGRRVPLNATQRETIWRIYEAFGPELDRKGVTSWQRIRRQAAAVLRAGAGPDPYHGVVVDEVQDLDPTVLRLMVLLCKSSNRLFIAADANQSIYGSSFRWTDVDEDLQVRGRTQLLRINYRSTRQIGEAAQSYLSHGAIEQEGEERQYVTEGAVPIVRSASNPEDEVRLLMRYFRQALGAYHLGRGGCAVLVPTNHTGAALAQRLCDAGVDAEWMDGDNLNLEKPSVKVMNLKSAKGLEFPIVAIAGFVENPRFGLCDGGDPEEEAERLQRERRSMFVGMTRAMRMLLVAAPTGDTTPLLEGFDRALWNMEKSEVAV